MCMLHRMQFIPNDAQRKYHAFLSQHPTESEYLIKMATGTGKSFLIQELLLRTTRSIVVFPRLALLSQFFNTYLIRESVFVVCECTDQDYCEEDNKYQKELTQLKRRNDDYLHSKDIIILTTYYSFPSIIQLYQNIILTIFDEAHHCNSPSLVSILTETKERCGTIFHFTATPESINRGVCFTYSLAEAIANDLVRDFELHVVLCSQQNQIANNKENFIHHVHSISRTSEIHQGKYLAFTAYSEAEVEDRNNVMEIKQEWSSFEAFWVQGITAKDSLRTRNRIFKEFAQTKKDLSILLSCRTLSEGIDLPDVNGCIFVDPRKNSREIIQIIGRSVRLFRDEHGKPLPKHLQSKAIIIIPVFIDLDDYSELEDADEKSSFLQNNIQDGEYGSFSTILNVCSALSQEDPETFQFVLEYPHANTGSKEHTETPSHLKTTNTETQARRKIQFHYDEGIGAIWSLDPEKMKHGLGVLQFELNDTGDLEEKALQKATEIVRRADERVRNKKDRLPKYKQKPKNDEEKQEKQHATSLFQWKYALRGKGNHKLYPSVQKFLDENLPGWCDDGEEKALQKAMEIVRRADERVRNGQERLPREKKNPKNEEEIKERQDSTSLHNWKNGLRGKGRNKLYPCVQKFLDENLPGWCDDGEEKALQKAMEIVRRADERERNGQNRLPKRKKDSEEQEQQDALILGDWRRALQGKGSSKLYPSVQKFLDENLPGWCDDLEEEALQKAMEIVRRADERERNGQNRLPKRKKDSEEQEKQDATSLGDWRRALQGKGSSKLYPSVQKFLDENLPGWCDIRNLEEEALQKAMEIVLRAEERVRNRQNRLPKKKKNPKNEEEKQEKQDAIILGDWKQALQGKGTLKLYPSVQKFLDENLPGWCNNKRTLEDDTTSSSASSTSSPSRPTKIRKILKSKTSTRKKVQRNAECDKAVATSVQESGIYNDDDPPHLEAKEYINAFLAQHIPENGKLILLDGIHFRTSKAINKPLRTIIPQFNYEHFETMTEDETFGHCVQYTQLTTFLRQWDATEPIGLLYADICGSMKEMEPILDELSTKTFTENAIVACTICARDAEKKMVDFTTKLMIKMLNVLRGWVHIGNIERIKYGNMCTIMFQKKPI